jgi:hypothetical protein
MNGPPLCGPFGYLLAETCLICHTVRMPDQPVEFDKIPSRARIRVIGWHCQHPADLREYETHVPIGTLGTVYRHDPVQNCLWVQWDNGETYSVWDEREIEIVSTTGHVSVRKP